MKTNVTRIIFCIGMGMAGLFLPFQLQAQDIKQDIVAKINQYRTDANLSPLKQWHDDVCADEQVKKDAIANRPHANFKACGEKVQNTTKWNDIQFVIPYGLKRMWDKGPGTPHYDNMMGNYSEVSVGIYKKSDGEVWVNMNFR